MLCRLSRRRDARAVFPGHRRIEIDAILDRWLDPARRYFKVRGDRGGIYILCHSAAEDCREMILFDGGARDETRLSSSGRIDSA